MDAPQSWGAYSAGDADTNVVVAIIDTGLDWRHPDLGGVGPDQCANCTDLDSLTYYNQGVVFRNWNEYPGDHSNDDAPGIEGVDDDGDGLKTRTRKGENRKHRGTRSCCRECYGFHR